MIQIPIHHRNFHPRIQHARQVRVVLPRVVARAIQERAGDDHAVDGPVERDAEGGLHFGAIEPGRGPDGRGEGGGRFLGDVVDGALCRTLARFMCFVGRRAYAADGDAVA